MILQLPRLYVFRICDDSLYLVHASHIVSIFYHNMLSNLSTVSIILLVCCFLHGSMSISRCIVLDYPVYWSKECKFRQHLTGELMVNMGVNS